MIRRCARLGLLGLVVCLASAWGFAAEQAEQKTFSGHEKDVFAVAFSADGAKLVSGSVDQTVKVWDVKTGKVLATLKGHNHSVRNVAFSPSGKQVASTAHDGSVRIWDVASGKSLKELPVKNQGDSVVFSADGKNLIGSSGGTSFNPVKEFGQITIWNVATGKEMSKIELPSYPSSMAVSRDGKLAACGFSGSTVRVWELGNGKQMAELGAAKEFADGGVAFTPDAKSLAGGVRFEVKLWEIASGQVKQTFAPGPGSRKVTSVAISRDGKVIAAGSTGYTAPEPERHRMHFWDLQSGKLLGTGKGHSGEVVTIAFSPDGKRLASASRDKTVKLFEVPRGE
jgi:WD40 repeat protein